VLASLGVLGTISLVGCSGFTGRKGGPPASRPTVEPTTTLRPPTTESTPVKTAPVTATATATTRPTATMPGGVSKVLAEDGESSALFGYSLGASGDTMFVGAASDTTRRGEYSGSVYVFEEVDGQWRQAEKLVPEPNWSGEQFGSIVAVDGSVGLVAGSTGDSIGRVSAFERTENGWEEQTTFPIEDESTRVFGESIGISGETAFVSDRWAHEATELEEGGGVRVYERTDETWERQTVLEPAEYEPHHMVAMDMACTEGTAFVDHYRPEGPNTVDVFERSPAGWEQQAVLEKGKARPENEFAAFGASISASECTAVVGASQEESGAGAAYIFERSAGDWTGVQRLTASDGDSEDVFGAETAIEEDFAVIGAIYDEDPRGDNCGSAYVFERRGRKWKEYAKLVAPDGESRDYFGRNIKILNGTVLVGAHSDDNSGGEAAGAVYLFDLSTVLG